MSEITKKALAASFMKLLNQTTLDKITIKDIVDECGVNRNTFYYHFQDVYDLMDWIFITEAKQVIDENKTYDNWQQGFLQSANYLLENKKLIFHAYNSLSREQLERYLYNITDNIMLNFVNEKAKDLNVSEEDRKFLADFYKYALVGLVLEWIRTGMKEDPKIAIDKMGKICDGHIRNALLNCQIKPQIQTNCIK